MPRAGEIADPGRYADDVRKLVGRGARSSSSSSTTTTEIPVLRIDGVGVKAGRGYRIGGSSYMLSSSVNSDGILARLRAATGGSTATVSSTLMAELLIQTLTEQGSGSGKLERFYYPVADETLSILLSVVRVQGSGNVSIAAVSNNIDLQVEDIGPDTGNIGVPL